MADISIPKKIREDRFDGPEKVMQEYNRLLETPLSEVMTDEFDLAQYIEEIQSETGVDVSKHSLVKEVPFKYLFDFYVEYLSSKVDEGMAPGTASNWLSFVRSYYYDNLRIARQKKLIDNYATASRENLPARDYSGADEYWSKDEVARIINFERDCENHRYAALWLLLYVYGRRIGEVLELTWEDIEDGRITFAIEKKESNVHSTFQLYQSVQRELERIEPQECIEYVFHGYDQPSNDSLQPANKPLSQQSVRHHLEKTTNSLDGVPTSSHTKRFRHSIATHMSQDGRPVKDIQGLLQHGDPSITMQIYARHVDEQSQSMDTRDIWGEAIEQ